MEKPKTRTIEEKQKLVADIEEIMEERGLNARDASEKEGITDANFYKLRQELRKKKVYLGTNQFSNKNNKPIVKIFNEPETPKKNYYKIKKAQSDKCIVIVTTSGSLRNILESL